MIKMIKNLVMIPVGIVSLMFLGLVLVVAVCYEVCQVLSGLGTVAIDTWSERNKT